MLTDDDTLKILATQAAKNALRLPGLQTRIIAMSDGSYNFRPMLKKTLRFIGHDCRTQRPFYYRDLFIELQKKNCIENEGPNAEEISFEKQIAPSKKKEKRDIEFFDRKPTKNVKKSHSKIDFKTLKYDELHDSLKNSVLKAYQEVCSLSNDSFKPRLFLKIDENDKFIVAGHACDNCGENLTIGVRLKDKKGYPGWKEFHRFDLSSVRSHLKEHLMNVSNLSTSDFSSSDSDSIPNIEQPNESEPINCENDNKNSIVTQNKHSIGVSLASNMKNEHDFQPEDDENEKVTDKNDEIEEDVSENDDNEMKSGVTFATEKENNEYKDLFKDDTYLSHDKENKTENQTHIIGPPIKSTKFKGQIARPKPPNKKPRIE